MKDSKQNGDNFYDNILGKLKNNRIIVFFTLLIAMIFGISEIIDTTVKIKNKIDDFSGLPTSDTTNLPSKTNLSQSNSPSVKPIDIIVFSPDNYSVDEKNIKKLISKVFPNSHIKMAGANWFEKQEFNESIIVYVKNEYKQAAVELEHILPGRQDVKLYIPNKPFFGLEKRDIALFCGKDLYK